MLQQRLGHQFANPALLTLALTHRSCGPLNNERMEFLGDSVINFIVADYLFRNFPKLSEGDLSRFRSAMVREDALAAIAVKLDLRSTLRTVQFGTASCVNTATLADAVEAVIAAVYEDGGMEKARQVVQAQINYLLTNKKVELAKDPKTQLQEHLQGRSIRLPQYTHVRNSEGQHIVKCAVPELSLVTEGTGHTRKEADRMAAQKALAICQSSRFAHRNSQPTG